MSLRDKEWLTMKEAAEYLGISYAQLSKRVKRGLIPASNVPGFNNTRRISRSRLDELMFENEKNGQDQ